MDEVSVFCPAKVNLTLAVTGRRDDGYHNLVSLVAPISLGDSMTVRRTGEAGFSLKVAGILVPEDGDNLVLRAARRFRQAYASADGFAFGLTKRIPVGSGLGGGSSNAVGALRALNRLSGCRASETELAEMAVDLGADCPLFLREGPVIMRGKGEQIETPADSEVESLLGRRLVLWKPYASVGTAWAYARLAEAGSYRPEVEAEADLAGWRKGRLSLESLMRNDFEFVVGRKYRAISQFLNEIRRDPGVPALMSGSGSACFALPTRDVAPEDIAGCVREAFGPKALCTCVRILKKKIDPSVAGG